MSHVKSSELELLVSQFKSKEIDLENFLEIASDIECPNCGCSGLDGEITDTDEKDLHSATAEYSCNECNKYSFSIYVLMSDNSVTLVED
jgi:hypothetical protein